MKITFDDTVSAKDWLHRCLLGSLTQEAIESGMETREYEVKLLVNGIELEPKLLNDLILNVEKYIDLEALTVFNKRYEEKAETLRCELDKLEGIIKEAQENIASKYNIEIKDYD